ncbi:MAG: LTA synthase family protein [Leptospiraceae bacterium]|nr:LTA synthase family protein [Leptospiraceae bacterium]MDW8305948.1 LTA synthase family protein [Leptospiraceae bacterium]
MRSLLYFFSLEFFITSYYRVEKLRILSEKVEQDTFSFGQYLFRTAWQDLGTSLLLALVPFLLYQGRRFWGRYGFYFFFFSYELIILAYYASALSVFKLYESLFELKFLRNISSIIQELIFSIWAELDIRLFHFFAIGLATSYLTIVFYQKNMKRSQALLALSFLLTSLPQGFAHPRKNMSFDPVIFKNPLWTAFFESEHEPNYWPKVSSGQAKLSSQEIHPAIYLPKKKYNIVFYFFESLPAKYIGYRYEGREVTPQWNRLIKNSLYFRRHYANFPLSINSFFNVFCSLPALPDGRWLSLVKPDFPHPCACELLAQAGYKTAILHAGDPDYAGQRRFYKYHGADIILDNDQVKNSRFDKNILPWGAADERSLVEKSLEIAKKLGEPFFLTLFPFNPHHPYSVPTDFPKFIEAVWEKLPYRKKIFLSYLNSLHFADFALGELVRRFEEENLAQDTLFFIFADHGEAFYEHPGNFNHPYYLYEENIHVPFLIYNKTLFPKTRFVDQITSHLDILPTLLDLLSLAAPTHLWGKSILRGGPNPILFLQTFWEKEWMGILVGNHKYLFRPWDKRRELYDILRDPEEKINLIQDVPELASVYHQIMLQEKQKRVDFFSPWISLLGQEQF